MNIQFPEKKDCRFVLMGSGLLMCQFLQALVEKEFPKPVVITHPYKEHARDRELLKKNERLYKDIFDMAKTLSVNIFESKDVNTDLVFEFLDEHNSNIAFSFGCRSIIKKRFLDRFKGKVLNSHASNLPWDRGSGGGTWRILNDEKYVYGLIHLVDEGLDTGEILIKEKKPLESTRPFPVDILSETWEFNIEVLQKFLDLIENGCEFKSKKQIRSAASFFPRLNTEKHGAINWHWKTINIERFIRAFGYPYPGAWTFVSGNKVYIGSCEIPEHSYHFHPYLVGIIFRDYDDGSVEVATVDGSIIVVSLREGDIEISPRKVCKLGERLYTPLNCLEESMLFKSHY